MESLYFPQGVFQHHCSCCFVFFPSLANLRWIGPGRISIIIGHFIRQDRPGTLSANVRGICAKPWLWMPAQKMYSICSPFSNQFSKVDFSPKIEKLSVWKGFHIGPGDIGMNTQPLANDAFSIYNLYELNWKQINIGRHTWTSTTGTCPSAASEWNSYAKPHLFLEAMSEIMVVNCPHGGTVIMKPWVISGGRSWHLENDNIFFMPEEIWRLPYRSRNTQQPF